VARNHLSRYMYGRVCVEEVDPLEGDCSTRPRLARSVLGDLLDLDCLIVGPAQLLVQIVARTAGEGPLITGVSSGETPPSPDAVDGNSRIGSSADSRISCIDATLTVSSRTAGEEQKERSMTVRGDVVVVNTLPSAVKGTWTSNRFETGGRLTRQGPNCGAEPDNSYVAVSLTSPTGNPDLAVSVEVNGQPLPVPIEVKSNSQCSAEVAFPASLPSSATGERNVIRLESQGRRFFAVL